MTLIIPPGKLANAISVARSLGSGALSLALGPWGKLIGIGILVGSGLLWFRLWLNRHDDRIHQNGRNDMALTMQKDYEAKLKAVTVEAKAMKETAAEDRRVAEALSTKIDAKFATVFVRLDGISEEVKKRDVVYIERTDAIPASELDGALRNLSNAIARQWPVR